jgi:hypothetical protein
VAGILQSESKQTNSNRHQTFQKCAPLSRGNHLGGPEKLPLGCEIANTQLVGGMAGPFEGVINPLGDRRGLEVGIGGESSKLQGWKVGNKGRRWALHTERNWNDDR